jgi:hypothetical protein
MDKDEDQGVITKIPLPAEIVLRAAYRQHIDEFGDCPSKPGDIFLAWETRQKIRLNCRGDPGGLNGT